MTKGNPDNNNAPRKIVIDKSKRDPNDKTMAEIKALPPEEQAAYLKQLEDTGREFSNAVKGTLREIVQPIFDMLQNEDFQTLLKDAEAREKVLMPYIDSVLKDPKNKGKYKDITAEQVLDNLDIMGRVINPEEISAEILKRAAQRQRAAEANKANRARTAEQMQKAGEKIKYTPGDTIKTTSTKLAQDFFSFAPPITEIDGQLTLNTVYKSDKGNDIAVLSYFNYNEKELTANGITSREFTDFDYFVAMVCNNLFSEGNKQVSLTKLWHEMGNPKSPNAQQIQELKKSLIKGMTTIINISNREVLEAWKINTDSYTDIKSPVMPVMLKTEHNKANGEIMSETVYIYAISPFILVADPLNQITTWKKEILKLYKGSRTARYWKIMRYLMQTIAWIRNGNGNRAPKITFKHLFDAVGAKRTEDRNATIKLTEKLLEEAFTPCGYVSSFKIDYQKACIDLKCTNPPGLPEKK